MNNSHPRRPYGADASPGSVDGPAVSTPRSGDRARHLFTRAHWTDWLGGIALFVALGGGMFLAWVMQ